MKITLLSVILQGIPEQIAVVFLAFSLAKVKFTWKIIVLFGSMSALLAYLIRLLPATFGVHTIILVALLFFYMSFYTEASVTTSIISALVSYLFLATVEALSFWVILLVFSISPEDVLFKNDVLKIISGYPQVIILFCAGYLMKIFRAIPEHKQGEIKD